MLPKQENKSSRRDVIKKSGSAVTLMMLGCRDDLSYQVSVKVPHDSVDILEQCEPSAPDMEGPYYREDIPVRSELDVYDDEAQSIIVSGQVCDLDCKPISFAIVEVWHADTSGEYDTVSSEMRYYGQLETDETGFYAFRTIIPAAYQTAPNDYRPKHFHIKIWVQGTEMLNTQLYFENDEFISYEPDINPDLILQLVAGEIVTAEHNFYVARPS